MEYIPYIVVSYIFTGKGAVVRVERIEDFPCHFNKLLTVKSDFVVEIKGGAAKLTCKGVETLALQVTEAINQLLATSDQ